VFRAEVFVTLKPVVNDPAGLTIKGGLHALGFESVTEVRAGKYLVLRLDASDANQARQRLDEMAQQLGLGVPELSRLLMHLEMKKVIRRLPGNQYERR